MPECKVVISHYGTHYHKPKCIATIKPKDWPFKTGYDDYYEIDVSELPKAKNDYGAGFHPCMICNAEKYIRGK